MIFNQVLSFFVILQTNYFEMKKISSIISILVTAMLLISLGSCTMKSKTIQPFTIAVDSLAGPDTVKIKMNFEIEIFGYIGPSKCYTFDKAYIYPNSNETNELRIEAWGIYTYTGNPCTDDPQHMKSTVKTSIFIPGHYIIRAVKTNYTFTEKTIVAVL